MRVLSVSIMTGVLVLAAACGGGGTAPTGPAGTAAACTGSGGTAVGIAGNAFNPASTTVAVGGTVTWTNADAATHTVTFDTGPDCGRLAQNASASRTFSAAGSFPYHCTIHPSMKGTVVVE